MFLSAYTSYININSVGSVFFFIIIIILLKRTFDAIPGDPRHSRQAGYRLRETKRGGSCQNVWLRGRILGWNTEPLAEDQAKTMGALQRTAFVVIGQGKCGKDVYKYYKYSHHTCSP